jgi:hypothetical protein
MSKSRSKGYIYGTPYIIRGCGGSRTIGILDRFGTHWRSATARRPEPRSGERATCPRSGLWHLCNSVSTIQHLVYSRHPAREAGTRASAKREHIERIAGAARCDIFATVYPRCNSRAAAHNLCASMRTTYTCTTQARLRHYVTLTYRVPLISIRGSLMNIYLYIDLTIIMG